MPESKRLNLQQIKDRNEEALRDLFNLLLPLLSRRARVYSSELRLSGLDVDDLVQDALLKIYAHLDKAPLDDESRFLAWCNVIARNVLLDSARKFRRRDLECDYYDAVVEESAAVEMSDPGVANLLKSLLDNLSQEDREVILLRAAGKPLAEIAEARGLSRATIYRRYRSIVDVLRERLEADPLQGRASAKTMK